jgi:hypothetical protein
MFQIFGVKFSHCDSYICDKYIVDCDHLNFYIYGKVKCSLSNFTFTWIDEFEKLVLS